MRLRLRLEELPQGAKSAKPCCQTCLKRAGHRSHLRCDVSRAARDHVDERHERLILLQRSLLSLKRGLSLHLKDLLVLLLLQSADPAEGCNVGTNCLLGLLAKTCELLPERLLSTERPHALLAIHASQLSASTSNLPCSSEAILARLEKSLLTGLAQA